MQINEKLTALEAVYHGMYMTVLVVLAIMLFACLIRAVKGPRVADRIVAVNMMGTMVMVMITVLSLLLEEGFLVDICLIYALVSFLAVIVITKVYVGVFRETQQNSPGAHEAIRNRNALETPGMGEGKEGV